MSTAKEFQEPPPDDRVQQYISLAEYEMSLDIGAPDVGAAADEADAAYRALTPHERRQADTILREREQAQPPKQTGVDIDDNEVERQRIIREVDARRRARGMPTSDGPPTKEQQAAAARKPPPKQDDPKAEWPKPNPHDHGVSMTFDADYNLLIADLQTGNNIAAIDTSGCNAADGIRLYLSNGCALRAKVVDRIVGIEAITEGDYAVEHHPAKGKMISDLLYVYGHPPALWVAVSDAAWCGFQ